MSVDFSVLEGAYLSDLLAQPHALVDTVAGLRRVPTLPERALSRRRILLTGMGSSLYAHHPLQLRLVRSGRTAMMVETAELVHGYGGLLDEDTLIVAVSQSGRSAETVQLLDLVKAQRSRPFLIGVTNAPDSPLAERADSVVLMQAGPEFSVSCKTYLSTLAVLEWLGATLCGDDLGSLLADLDQAAPSVGNYLAAWRTHATQLTTELAALKHLFLMGRGVSLAAAGTGALILKESTRFHAEGISSPAFRHGPLEMVSSGLYAVVFEGAPATAALNTSLARDIRTAGGRAALVSEKSELEAFRLPAAPARLLPILEMLPVQMISLTLAAIAGRQPGKFERATKVTLVA